MWKYTTFASNFFPNSRYELSPHNWVAGHLQHLYDAGLVWPPEAGREQLVQQTAADRGDPDQLAHRLFRVLLPGACQPHRLSGKWGQLLPASAKGDPGGDHPHRIRNLLLSCLSDTTAVEPPDRLRVAGVGCLLHLQELNADYFSLLSHRT